MAFRTFLRATFPWLAHLGKEGHSAEHLGAAHRVGFDKEPLVLG